MSNPKTEQEVKKLKKVLNNYQELFNGLEEALICATDVTRKFELKHQVDLLKKFTIKLSKDIEALEKGEIAPAECKKYKYEGGFNNAYIISILKTDIWREIEIPHNVPFRNCDYFVGREEELEQLRVQLEEKNKILISPAISVSGSGGIGKTQLVTEYCYRNTKTYQAICWVDASKISFATEYANLAENPLDLPEQKKQIKYLDVKQEMMNIEARMRAVKLALQTKFTNVLLVLDNVEKPVDYIKPWLPNTSNCNVILTSRLRNILNIEELDLNLLPESVACKLLCSRRPDLDPKSEEAKKTTKRLARLPLALDIAAHYLGMRKDITLEDYNQALDKCINVLEHKSQFDPKHYESYTEHQNRTVYLTIMETYNVLEPTKQELLQYISWCYPENIPLDWLKDSTNWEKDKFYEAIADLHDYNLLLDWHYSAEGGEARTHSLINEVINIEVKKKEENATIQVNSLLKNVKAYFNDPADYHNWEQQSRYAQHASNLLLIDCEKYTDNKIDIAWLGNQVGTYFHQTGNYQEAEPLLRKALMIRKKVLGEEHPDTAQSINNLALLLSLTGRYEESEPL